MGPIRDERPACRCDESCATVWSELLPSSLSSNEWWTDMKKPKDVTVLKCESLA